MKLNGVVTHSDIPLMLQVSRLYYDGGLTQQQIAEKFDMTRQAVARLLAAARESGIVRISIHDPIPQDTELREQMIDTFGLHNVFLTSTGGLDEDQLRAHLGMSAGEALAGLIKSGDLVGTGWGRTLYEVANSIPPGQQIAAHFIPVIGGIGDLSPFFQVNELVSRLAEVFGGTFRHFYAPAFTPDADTLKIMTRTNEVAQMIELWRKLDAAIIGVGYLAFQQISGLFFADHISPGALARLESKGAVGDLCGQFFDVHGNLIDLDNQIIGIHLDDLKRTPEVVAIAGGANKIRALLGALRGGYIKILVTDTDTARLILSEHHERR